MADGMVKLHRREELARYGALLLRKVIPLHWTVQLAALQHEIDDMVTASLDDQVTPVSRCLVTRYTLTADDIGAARFDELVEQVATPIARLCCGDLALERLKFGGVFVVDPRLPRNQDFHWHTDGHFDGLDHASLTVWIPLRDCGARAPGLAWAEAAEFVSLDALPQGAEPDRHTDVFWPAVTDRHVTRHIGRIRAPAMKLGDVVVFTSRTLHRTHFHRRMKLGRAALVARFIAREATCFSHDLNSA